jgi:hypothetical protein
MVEKPCYGLQVTSKKTKVQGTRIKEKGKRNKGRMEGWNRGRKEVASSE